MAPLRHLALVCAIVGTACALAPTARAQDANQERIAETLFQDARALMNAGKFSDACPKFAASQKASPSTGTELNLADCYEKGGATASAWALYLDVARAALKENRKDRETIAKTRASALEPKLSRMKIVVPSPNVEVRRNGTVVEPALLGSAEPIDPGSYVIEVSAKGKKTWSQTFAVTGGTTPLVVTVPELALEVAPASPVTTPPTPSPRDATPVVVTPGAGSPSPDTGTSRSGSPLRIVALVTGGVGVVGLGVGTAFGFVAMGKQSSAGCAKNVCPTESAAQTIRDAESAGTISTIAFLAGGVLAATGVVLFFVAPKAPSTSSASLHVTPTVAPGTMGLGLGGTF